MSNCTFLSLFFILVISFLVFQIDLSHAIGFLSTLTTPLLTNTDSTGLLPDPTSTLLLFLLPRPDLSSPNATYLSDLNSSFFLMRPLRRLYYLWLSYLWQLPTRRSMSSNSIHSSLFSSRFRCSRICYLYASLSYQADLCSDMELSPLSTSTLPLLLCKLLLSSGSEISQRNQ